MQHEDDDEDTSPMEGEDLAQLRRDLAEGRMTAQEYAAARRDLSSSRPAIPAQAPAGRPSPAVLVLLVVTGTGMAVRGLLWLVPGIENRPSPWWLLAGLAVLAGTRAYYRRTLH